MPPNVYSVPWTVVFIVPEPTTVALAANGLFLLLMLAIRNAQCG
jgi:hypothetical protein